MTPEQAIPGWVAPIVILATVSIWLVCGLLDRRVK